MILPISFAITFALLGPPMFFDGEMHSEGFGPGFVPVIIVPILFFCCMVRIGICRWFVLSKSSKKYVGYKQLQRRVDEKLDFDKDEGKE
jgi:hypothetical protein